jgi:hypothetical protein
MHRIEAQKFALSLRLLAELVKSTAALAVRREAKEDWGKPRWRGSKKKPRPVKREEEEDWSRRR